MQLMNEQTVLRLLHASEYASNFRELAIGHFANLYPKASPADLRSAGDLIDALTTGAFLVAGVYPLETYARAVIVGTIGGTILDDGTVRLPSEGVCSSAPASDEQTVLLFNLIETLYFKTRIERGAARRAQLMERGNYGATPAIPQNEDDRKRTIQEAIDLLEATRSAFKSKLIMQAKEKLRALL